MNRKELLQSLAHLRQWIHCKNWSSFTAEATELASFLFVCLFWKLWVQFSAGIIAPVAFGTRAAARDCSSYRTMKDSVYQVTGNLHVRVSWKVI